MSTTQHTGHYNLPTFGDNPNDRPSWRGDFTDAMTKIDNQMYANATNIATATAAANNATTANRLFFKNSLRVFILDIVFIS